MTFHYTGWLMTGSFQIMGPDPTKHETRVFHTKTPAFRPSFCSRKSKSFDKPIGSMYGIFTYIWLIFMVNVGKYTSPMDAMGKFGCHSSVISSSEAQAANFSKAILTVRSSHPLIAIGSKHLQARLPWGFVCTIRKMLRF